MRDHATEVSWHSNSALLRFLFCGKDPRWEGALTILWPVPKQEREGFCIPMPVRQTTRTSIRNNSCRGTECPVVFEVTRNVRRSSLEFTVVRTLPNVFNETRYRTNPCDRRDEPGCALRPVGQRKPQSVQNNRDWHLFRLSRGAVANRNAVFLQGSLSVSTFPRKGMTELGEMPSVL
jgi:hypothetical protein